MNLVKIAILFALLAGTIYAQDLPDAPSPKPSVLKTVGRKINPFKTIDVTSPWFVNMTAQFAHVGAGYGVVTSMDIKGHNTAGLVGMGSFVLTKEFFYDKKYEHQSFKDNFIDASFYGLGMGLAVLQNIQTNSIRRKP